MRFTDMARVDNFDPGIAEIVIGWGVAIAQTALREALADAARADGHGPGAPGTFPVWCVIVGQTMPVDPNGPERVDRQLVMDAGVAYAILGGLQGWAEWSRGQLPVGVADQLDQIRAEARRRFKTGAAALDPTVYGPGLG